MMTPHEWKSLKPQEVIVHAATNVRFRLEMKDHAGYWIALEFTPQGGGHGLSRLRNNPESWKRAEKG